MEGNQTRASMEEHWCLRGQGMTQDISGNYRSTCPNSPQLLGVQLGITVCCGEGVTWSCITEAWGCPGGPEISKNLPISWSLCAAYLALPQPWTKACRDGWLLHPLVLVEPAADLGQTSRNLSLVLDPEQHANSKCVANLGLRHHLVLK